MLDTAEAVAGWLPASGSHRVPPHGRQTHGAVQRQISELRKRLEPTKDQLPADLADSVALRLNAIAELLGVRRNEAGHPTGGPIDHHAASINLQLCAR